MLKHKSDDELRPYDSDVEPPPSDLPDPDDFTDVPPLQPLEPATASPHEPDDRVDRLSREKAIYMDRRRARGSHVFVLHGESRSPRLSYTEYFHNRNGTYRLLTLPGSGISYSPPRCRPIAAPPPATFLTRAIGMPTRPPLHILAPGQVPLDVEYTSADRRQRQRQRQRTRARAAGSFSSSADTFSSELLGRPWPTSPPRRLPQCDDDDSTVVLCCAYPGCERLFVRSESVRKHARKYHKEWLSKIDKTLPERLRCHFMVPASRTALTRYMQEYPGHAVPRSIIGSTADSEVLPEHVPGERPLNQGERERPYKRKRGAKGEERPVRFGDSTRRGFSLDDSVGKRRKTASRKQREAEEEEGGHYPREKPLPGYDRIGRSARMAVRNELDDGTASVVLTPHGSKGSTLSIAARGRVSHAKRRHKMAEEEEAATELVRLRYDKPEVVGTPAPRQLEAGGAFDLLVPRGTTWDGAQAEWFVGQWWKHLAGASVAIFSTSLKRFSTWASSEHGVSSLVAWLAASAERGGADENDLLLLQLLELIEYAELKKQLGLERLAEVIKGVESHRDPLIASTAERVHPIVLEVVGSPKKEPRAATAPVSASAVPTCRKIPSASDNNISPPRRAILRHSPEPDSRGLASSDDARKTPEPDGGEKVERGELVGAAEESSPEDTSYLGLPDKRSRKPSSPQWKRQPPLERKRKPVANNRYTMEHLV